MLKSGTGGSGPRILHLVPVDGIGGVEVAAKSMLKRADLPCCFCVQFIEPSLPEGRTAVSLARALRAHWRALRPARDFAPDVIICSLWRSVPLGLTLRTMLPRAKLVYFVHSDAARHRVDDVVARLAMRAADEVWGDSATTLMSRGAPSDRSRVISFVTERIALADKEFAGARFVSWGRLAPQKGYDRAIRFARLLCDSGVDLRYDIYGPDNSERGTLLALISTLGLEGKVRLMGAISRDRLPTVAADYAFFLQPSRFEGMCMGAVEGMQYGLVPVTTPVGEMARYVVPGKTGVLMDPERMEEAAAAVKALIENPDEWRKLSAAAMGHWRDAPLYADDFYRAAAELVGKLES